MCVCGGWIGAGDCSPLDATIARKAFATNDHKAAIESYVLCQCAVCSVVLFGSRMVSYSQ